MGGASRAAGWQASEREGGGWGVAGGGLVCSPEARPANGLRWCLLVVSPSRSVPGVAATEAAARGQRGPARVYLVGGVCPTTVPPQGGVLD